MTAPATNARGGFPAFLRTVDDPRGAVLDRPTAVAFQHLPKTAGSTFRRILESLREPDTICPAEIDRELPGRISPLLYAGHFSFEAMETRLTDALWLTMLRDPVERVVSEIANVADWSRFPAPWRRRIEARPALVRFVETIRTTPLEELVRADDPLVRDRLVNRQTRSLVAGPHGRDVWNAAERILEDPVDPPLDDPALLAEAKRHLRERFVFVGLQEHFRLSLQLLAMTFGLRPFGDTDAFTINRNPARRSGEAYALPEETRAHLEALNRMDLELWRYGRTLLFERLGAFHDHYLRVDAWRRRPAGRAAAAPGAGFPAFIRTADDPRGRDLAPPPDVVFHHMPKTAGSTFRRILESQFDPEAVCPAEIDDEVRALGPAERRRYRLYAGHFSHRLLEEAFGDAVRLTFLRDPVQRVLSNFHNITRPDRHQPQWRRRAEERPDVRRFIERVAGMSLAEFVHLDDPRARKLVVNLQTRYLVSGAVGPLDVGPEDARLASPYDASMVAEAKRNLRDRFAFVGIQEQFALSLQLFAMTFGLRPFGDLEAYTINLKPGKRPRERYELTADLRAYLEEHNRMDRELWDFARTLVHERLAAFHDHYLREDDWSRRHPERCVRPPAGAGGPRASVRREIEALPERRGFHRLERDGHRRGFCWSGYEDPAVLEIELEVADDARLGVAVEALSAIDEAARDGLAITFDGTPLEGLRLTRRDDRLVYEGTVRTGRPAWPRRHHAIKLSGPRALEPETVEHRRRLGVAVHAVSIEVLDH